VRSESPSGQVLAPVAKYTKEYDSHWEPEVAKLPVVISFPGTELKSRDVVIGLAIGGSARAYPWETFAKQSPVLDRVNGTPLLVALGPMANPSAFLSAALTAATPNSSCKQMRKTGRWSMPPLPASGTSRVALSPARAWKVSRADPRAQRLLV